MATKQDYWQAKSLMEASIVQAANRLDTEAREAYWVMVCSWMTEIGERADEISQRHR